MVIAYHCTFTTYGFWLSNDSRGSWSDFVRSFDLYVTGAATKTDETRSLAKRNLDRAQRAEARAALTYPIVRLNWQQIESVARGFARAVEESDYVILACAILWDHVHMVVERYPGRTIEKIIGHLKTRATQRLTAAGLNPMAQYVAPDGRYPSVWVQHGWNVFLNDREEIDRAVQYDEQNPEKMGLPPQNWSFVTRR
ncbi:MAG: transposase [Planctomycetota bacterium]|nr:transposase [Planctomycetota bacterium]